VAAALVASVVAVGLGTNSAKADMFSIAASSPGTVSFSGQGTAQFNNSLGSNNSFQVGSSTNLGVNASASSTPEYGVEAGAALNLGGTTTLKQVIGTSGNDASKTRTHERAHTRANERTAEAGFGVSYDRASGSGGNNGYESEGEWNVARNAAYSNAYTNSVSSEASAGTSNSSNGTISGSFTTVESGRASAAGQASDWETKAASAVEVSHGRDYENRSGSYTNSTEVEWQASRDSSYEAEYAKSAANSNRFSDSSVSVTGIGSDANIAANETSSFTVDIAASGTGTSSAGTSTANGSSGASLSTSSFANQSNAQTASGFIQAFGGGGAVSDTTTPAN
jgi:hypothetical protein